MYTEPAIPSGSPGLGDKVDELLRVLSREGFEIGAAERASVALIAAYWLSQKAQTPDTNDKQDEDATSLRSHLSPLLARNPKDRDKFDWAFKQVFEPVDERKGSVNSDVRRIGSLTGVAIAAGLILVAALIWWLVQFQPPSLEAPFEAPVAAPASIQLQTQAQATSPDAPTDVFQEGESSTARFAISRVEGLAAEFDYAPTLRELGRSAFEQGNKQAAQSPEDHILLLERLSGFPANTPLRAYDDSQVLAQLAFALEKIEEPDSQLRFIDVALEAEQAIAGSARSSVERLRRQILADPLAQSDDAATRDGVLEAASLRYGSHPASTFERAFALAGSYPSELGVPHWMGAPLSQHDRPRSVIIEPWKTAIAFLAISILVGLILRSPRAYLRRKIAEAGAQLSEILGSASVASELFSRTIQPKFHTLQKRTRKTSERVDIERTINRALRHGGHFLDPVYTELQAQPEYLFLIERRSAADLQAQFMRQILETTKDYISFEVLYFETDPSFLETEDGMSSLSVWRAHEKYPDHRLVILGECAGFLSRDDYQLRASARGIQQWDVRAILSTAAVADWGREEFELAKQLNMPVGRATVEGLANLSSLLGLDDNSKGNRIDPTGDQLTRSVASVLNSGLGGALSKSEPNRDDVSQLIRTLRNSLSANAFDWLACLAVYPSVQWDLTLHIGRGLSRHVGGDPRLTPLFNSESLAEMTRLPWLINGRMPDWLRRALIDALSTKRVREVRTFVLESIGLLTPAEADKSSRLRFTIAQDTKTGPLGNFQDDQVFLEFLSSPRKEDFEVSSILKPKEAKPRRLPHRFMEQMFVLFALSCAAALVAYLVTPPQWAALSFEPGGLPLLVLALGLICVLSLWSPQRTVKTFGVVLERTAAGVVGVAVLTLTWLAAYAAWMGSRSDETIARIGTELPSSRYDFWQFSSDVLGTSFVPGFLVLVASGALALLSYRFLAERLGLRVFASDARTLEGALLLLVKGLCTGYLALEASYALAAGGDDSLISPDRALLHAALISFLAIGFCVASWFTANSPNTDEENRPEPTRGALARTQAGRTALVALCLTAPLLVESLLVSAPSRVLLDLPITGQTDRVAVLGDGNGFAVLKPDRSVTILNREGRVIGGFSAPEASLSAAIALSDSASPLRVAFGTATGGIYTLEQLDDGVFVRSAQAVVRGLGGVQPVLRFVESKLFAAYASETGEMVVTLGGQKLDLKADHDPVIFAKVVARDGVILCRLSGALDYVDTSDAGNKVVGLLHPAKLDLKARRSWGRALIVDAHLDSNSGALTVARSDGSVWKASLVTEKFRLTKLRD